MPNITEQKRVAEWLSPRQLAEEIGVPLATVYKWNHEGTGPRVHRLGRHVRYRRCDLDRWLDAQRTKEHTAGRW